MAEEPRLRRSRSGTLRAALLSVGLLTVGLIGYWTPLREAGTRSQVSKNRTSTALGPEARRELANAIESNADLRLALERARELLADGLNAGGIYPEVWIRDLNTFIEMALGVQEPARIRQALLVFFHFQQQDGAIVDSYVAEHVKTDKYEHVESPTLPGFKAHKNTVATDQESSLVQAVYKYITKTGDRSILDERIGPTSVKQRLALALDYLLRHRYDADYGLLWGATSVDWGDVQPEDQWGIRLDENSHRAIDVYDNAMLLIALNNYTSLLGSEPGAQRWRTVATQLKARVRRHLWDGKLHKFRPHIYLDGSPFPSDFDEHRIYYHGGTAVAIEAGLLDRLEVRLVLEDMRNNARFAGAASIGLAVFPAYPRGFFKNTMMRPYNYQNGGDWTWYGGRMIQQLVLHGYVEEAYTEILPMVHRSNVHDGFHEWYTARNEPRGSSTYRGTAGVLGKAIELLFTWARDAKKPSNSRT